jgi:hypothetical protein
MAMGTTSVSVHAARYGLYFFNRGHYFIPYYFGKPRTATFHCDEAGILTDFEYNHED